MIYDRNNRLINHRSALPGVDKAVHLVGKEGLTLAQAFERAGIEVRVKKYPTKDDDARLVEVHEHTIDLMVALSGREVIHLCDPAELTPGAPLPDGADGRKLQGAPRGLAFTLEAGHFLAIFPGEAHMVGGHPQTRPDTIDKLVIKLPALRPDEGTCPCKADCPRHGICAECVVWHRNPNNSLPTCLREKGKVLIERALREAGMNNNPQKEQP